MYIVYFLKYMGCICVYTQYMGCICVYTHNYEHFMYAAMYICMPCI